MYPKLYIKRREARKRQIDLAIKTNMHKQSYYLKESGKRDFTIQEGLKLARALNCTLNDLFEGDDVLESLQLKNQSKDYELLISDDIKRAIKYIRIALDTIEKQ